MDHNFDMGGWPPPYDVGVAAPAGEPARPAWAPTGRLPSKEQLDWAHQAIMVFLLILALIGVTMLVGARGPSWVLKGAAQKHAVGEVS